MTSDVRIGHRSLNVWQESMAVIKDVYLATGTFPRDELYGLTSQLRRAAVSVPMNIAEGYKRRRYTKDYVRFLVTAQGSQGEVETALEIAVMLEYMSKDKCDELIARYDEVGRMLSGLIDSIEKGTSSGR